MVNEEEQKYETGLHKNIHDCVQNSTQVIMHSYVRAIGEQYREDAYIRTIMCIRIKGSTQNGANNLFKSREKV